jgi:hypothetical protein
MHIPESDHAELNEALLELRNLYRPNPNFRPEIIAEAHALVDECCRLPEWDAKENYMDAGLAAVSVHLKNYPWLTEKAFYAVRFECMMTMK